MKSDIQDINKTINDTNKVLEKSEEIDLVVLRS